MIEYLGYYAAAAIVLLLSVAWAFLKAIEENEYVKVNYMSVGERTIAYSNKYFGKKLAKLIPEHQDVIMVSGYIGKELHEDELVYDGYVGFIDKCGIAYTHCIEPFALKFAGRSKRELSIRILEKILIEEIHKAHQSWQETKEKK